MNLKRALTSVLTPAAYLAERFGEPWSRAWAHARLSQKLGYAIDPSVVLLGLPEVHGTRRIDLGRELYLYRELYLETQEQGAIWIGDGCVISRGVHIVAFRNIAIGPGSMIGEYASLRDANHRLDLDRPVRTSGHDAAPITIGREVWIGRGAVILPGVAIGDRAVVGANAVVTKDVPARTVVAGVPAKVLRTLERKAA
ncbi:MAG: acyltransferase [Planctomycetota bacterium]